jgi:crotonobetainyl-CoA:carnitine CoA-transferase CaiB-like acyl-CoA transferase
LRLARPGLPAIFKEFSVSDHPNLPLAGIVVLDFGQVFQGPYATLLMAKAGADVIKIEPPHGEPLRWRAPPGQEHDLPDRDAQLEQARDHP